MKKVGDLNRIVGELRLGQNNLIQYRYNHELSQNTLDWSDEPITHVLPEPVIHILSELGSYAFGKYINYRGFKAELMAPVNDFWSAFLPSDFFENHDAVYGDQREGDRKANPYDLSGVECAGYLSNAYGFGFSDYLLNEMRVILASLPLPHSFQEKTFKWLTEVCPFFKQKDKPGLAAPYLIETGGWVPNNDSLVLLTREDSKRPTYQFRVMVEEAGVPKYKEVTLQDLKEIRESIRNRRKALLKGSPVNWVIFDAKKGEPIVIPERFPTGNNFETAGAIIVFADYPKEQAKQILKYIGSEESGISKEKVLAFMGDRAPASAVSPLMLTETYARSASPFKKIFDLKDEILEKIKGKDFEFVVQFTFKDWGKDNIPDKEEIRNVEIVGAPRALG